MVLNDEQKKTTNINQTAIFVYLTDKRIIMCTYIFIFRKVNIFTALVLVKKLPFLQ